MNLCLLILTHGAISLNPIKLVTKIYWNIKTIKKTRGKDGDRTKV